MNLLTLTNLSTISLVESNPLEGRGTHLGYPWSKRLSQIHCKSLMVEIRAGAICFCHDTMRIPMHRGQYDTINIVLIKNINILTGMNWRRKPWSSFHYWNIIIYCAKVQKHIKSTAVVVIPAFRLFCEFITMHIKADIKKTLKSHNHVTYFVSK